MVDAFLWRRCGSKVEGAGHYEGIKMHDED